MKRERERGTWLGLIATPLSGWEILRAMMLGPVLSRLRGALTPIALWTVGLMAGAVHPLGFLAAVTGLAASAWFFSALGVSRSLREGGMKRAGHPLALVVRRVAALAVTLFVGAISSALAWSSLLSYEDVFSVVHSGAFVQFGATALQKVVGVPDNMPIGARVLLFGSGALQTVVGPGPSWALVGRHDRPGGRGLLRDPGHVPRLRRRSRPPDASPS